MPRGLSKLFRVAINKLTGARTMALLVLWICIEVLPHIFLKKVIAEVRGTLNINGGLYLPLWGILARALGGNA